MSKEYYKISKEDLLNFITRDLKLSALESGGIENWSWYGDIYYNYLNMIFKELGLEIVDDCDLSMAAEVILQDYKKDILGDAFEDDLK